MKKVEEESHRKRLGALAVPSHKQECERPGRLMPQHPPFSAGSVQNILDSYLDMWISSYVVLPDLDTRKSEFR